jgi:Oxidoreductase family, NAD-binding Rossmann fold
MNRRAFVRNAALTAGGLAFTAAWIGRTAVPFSGRWELEAGGAAESDCTDPIRLALLGAGSRGLALTAELLARPGASVTAVCDVRDASVRAVWRLYGAVPRYPSYLELLDAPDVDAVVVATPDYLHAEHVAAALRSGRNVHALRPRAISAHDRRRILEAVESSGRAPHFFPSTSL